MVGHDPRAPRVAEDARQGLIVDVKTAWLARDRMGQLALFVREARADDFDALEAEARVLGALAARDGTGWIPAQEQDAEVARVVVVLGAPDRDGGYRDAARTIPVEDSVSASWVVAREDGPRVLVSRRPLAREEREALRARDDCAALLVERAARELVRSRADAVHVYVRAARAYERAGGPVARPLRARGVPGRVVRLPVEFASSAAVPIADEFDGTTDGALRQTLERPTFGELVLNFVRWSAYGGLFAGIFLGEATHSVALGVLGWIASAGLVTWWLGRGWSRQRIVPRPPPPSRVSAEPARARVGEDAEPADEPEARAAAEDRSE